MARRASVSSVASQLCHIQLCLLPVVLQLRDCLESEVYELFHKKLTEQALIKDPKFLWCCHVSSHQPLGPDTRF